VTVLRNNGSGLVVKIETKNTETTPHVTGQAVFEMVARAGGNEFRWDCADLGCMGDELQPGGSRVYTLARIQWTHIGTTGDFPTMTAPQRQFAPIITNPT
jgi:hypothetical protein